MDRLCRQARLRRAVHGQFAQRRIERRKEPVDREHAGRRELIEQGRLAGVRVPNERNGRNRSALPLTPSLLTLFAHLL
jgi:hypothetical protein